MSEASPSPAPPADESVPFLTRIVEVFLRGDVAILLTVVSLVAGAVALVLTPREEEPQIVVPLADVVVRAPGLSAAEVERQVAERLEKLLFQIDGVEYVYSMSKPGQCVVTVRFYVGEDREDSLVKLYNKITSNTDQIPPAVTQWVVKPVEVDDVPIVIVSLWSEKTDRYGHFELRRIAEQLQKELQAVQNTNRVWVVGGRPRRIRVELDTAAMAARHTAPLEIANALRASNVNVRAGAFEQQDRQFLVEAGTFVPHARALERLVVKVWNGRPVYLKDVARVLDGPAEIDNYSWIGFGPANETEPRKTEYVFPAVHLAVAKRKGTNAVWVAEAIDERMRALQATHFPDGVHYRITRDYGETAKDKVDELVEGLAVAVLTVVGLIGIVIGWRAALVIALAIPVCYGITLFINLLTGYTINRVTMFALTLSLGLLVDDPITDVENIARYFAMRILPARPSVLRAIQEVRPALILSTLAIIVSFLPLMFITGMMGPYMAPMAMNVPLTVSVSTVVAFVITPWLAMVSLRRMLDPDSKQPRFELEKRPLYRLSKRVLGPILDRRWLCWVVLAGVVLLMMASLTLPMLRMIPLKMLPFDNKNEFQIVIDMPEGTTLDRTDVLARRLGRVLAGVAEVRDYEIYVGVPSPMDFNGMVRHYFLRRGPNLADIRVNLVMKDYREQQSHEILLRLRNRLTEIATSMGGRLKLVEVPPGPPVLATITAEVYGPSDAAYADIQKAARRVEARLAREPLVVDVDTTIEDRQTRWIFETDKPKAAVSGVSAENIAKTMRAALGGLPATVLHNPREVNPLWIELRLPRASRSALEQLEEVYVVGRGGQLVQIGALGKFVERADDQTIYHKNLQRVVYVYGEVAGRAPAEAIVDMLLDRVDEPASEEQKAEPRPLAARTWLRPGGGDPWSIPEGFRVEWAGEGEWKITLDVFRDLGIAFAAAQVGIFIILMFQTRSRVMPLVIMLAIPLTLIGIMPGFWILNQIVDRPIDGYPNPVFFTATAMIGMIGLSGIVVRNSVVLIDFIHHGREEGLPMREAVIRSVAIRTRPILLTAGTTLLGNWVITLDPIFSGLAWSIIFGILASTIFTLIVVPIVCWLLYRYTPVHHWRGEAEEVLLDG